MIARDLFNRAHGAVAETQARLMEVEVSDDVLEERVRAKLGHVLAHVSALEISAKGGQVVLAGEALVDEIEPLLSRTRGVRGVKSVESHVTARAWGADGHAVPAPA